jgi:hypothetical protein
VTFTDAQEMHRRYPSTFSAPTQAELDAVRPGDYVLAAFNHIERMWVLVTAVDGDTLAGTLSNQPVEVPRRHGDLVTLEKRHVFDIQTAAAVTEGTS